MPDGQREEIGFCGFMWRTLLIIAFVLSVVYALLAIVSYAPANDGFGTHAELTKPVGEVERLFTEKKNDK